MIRRQHNISIVFFEASDNKSFKWVIYMDYPWCCGVAWKKDNYIPIHNIKNIEEFQGVLEKRGDKAI